MNSLCFLFLIYVPLTQPVGVLIDGSINFDQNWSIEFTPSLLRESNSTIHPEVSAIIAEIANTTTTVDPAHVKRRSDLPFQILQEVSLPNSQRSTKKRFKKKSSNNLQGAGADLKAVVQSINVYTLKDTFKDPSGTTIIDEIETSNKIHPQTEKSIKRKHKKKARSMFTARIEIPLGRFTKQMTYITESKSVKKIKKKSHKKQSKINTPQVKDGQNFDDLLETFGVLSAGNGVEAPEAVHNPRGRWNPTPLEKVTLFYNQQPLFTGKSLRINHHSDDLNQMFHLVKNDLRLQNFTLEVFKQSIGVFDAIKSKVNSSKVKSKVDFVARNYKNKFSNFVQENQNQKIITRLGTQKVVLNTIETSNRIMRRLINFFIGDMEKKGVLRDNEGLAVVWRNQVENGEQQEYVLACQKFNICRSKYSLSSFMADYFTVLLQVDDQKLKQAIDALTEVLKETDFSTVMDISMMSRFESNIAFLEKTEPSVIRPIIWMFRNMLINKNQPLVIEEQIPQKVINQTVAMMDVVDLLDEKIPATEENLLEWNDMRNSLVRWANGQRRDVLEVMQAFVNMVVLKGINKMDTTMTHTFNDKFKVFLRATI